MPRWRKKQQESKQTEETKQGRRKHTRETVGASKHFSLEQSQATTRTVAEFGKAGARTPQASKKKKKEKKTNIR